MIAITKKEENKAFSYPRFASRKHG